MVFDSFGSESENSPAHLRGLVEFFMVTVDSRTSVMAHAFADEHRAAVLQESFDGLFALVAYNHPTERTAFDFDGDSSVNESIVESPHSFRMKPMLFGWSQTAIS